MKPIPWLPVFGLAFLISSIHAEGNCPAGQYPIGAPQGQGGPQGCAPIPGYNNQTQNSIRPPQWVNQWGAIASHIPSGIVGISSSLPDAEQAKQVAMADCKAKGAPICKMEIAYENQCVAMTVGQGGYAIELGSTAHEAEQKGMNTCRESGFTSCHIYYTDCSLPVQIQ